LAYTTVFPSAPRRAAAERVAGDRGAAVRGSAGVALHDLGGVDVDVLRPQPAGATAVEGDALTLPEGQELLDTQAEDVAERAGVPALVHGVVLVHDAGEVRRDQAAAVGDEPAEVVGG